MRCQNYLEVPPSIGCLKSRTFGFRRCWIADFKKGYAARCTIRSPTANLVAGQETAVPPICASETRFAALAANPDKFISVQNAGQEGRRTRNLTISISSVTAPADLLAARGRNRNPDLPLREGAADVSGWLAGIKNYGGVASTSAFAIRPLVSGRWRYGLKPVKRMLSMRSCSRDLSS